MLSRFYPSHVISRLCISEEEYWDSRGLSPNDCVGLAGLLYADVFGLDFLTPLGEIDTRFRLDPHQQVYLSRYADLVHTTEIGKCFFIIMHIVFCIYIFLLCIYFELF